jgi:uncharacterized membrane protein
MRERSATPGGSTSLRLLRAIARHDLVFLNVLGALAVITIAFLPTSVARMALGAAYLLFLPGYAAMAALVPGNDRLALIERVALSIGLSVAIVSFVALALTFTPWGILPMPVVWAVALLILISSVVAWIRRRRRSSG